MEDNLIKQSKSALFMLSFNTFKKIFLLLLKTEPFCAYRCIYLFFLNQDQIKYNDDLVVATNLFILYLGTKL